MSGPHERVHEPGTWGPVTPTFEPVEFPSGGVTLRGRLYRGGTPEQPAPALVMAPGFSGTITMVFPRYAEAFASAGLTVLLFDNAGWGRSDGEPRFEVEKWQQVRGYLAAADYLRDLESIDADRIGFWGYSTSAEVATVAAAVDGRIAALVAQMPCWGVELSEPEDRPGDFERLRDAMLNADLTSWPRDVIGPMPVVSPEPQTMPAFSEPLSAFRWCMEFATAPETGWINRATFAVLSGPVALDAQLCIPEIRAPTLVVTAQEDEMCTGQVPRDLTSRFGGPTEALVLGGGHFSTFYPESPEFRAAIEAERSFLLRGLGRVGTRAAE